MYVGNAFLAELMGTALLVYTVLETAVNAKSATTEGKAPSPATSRPSRLPIGLAVFIAHVVLIPITGCSINPTRSFGPSVVANSWANHWIWWIGPLSGSLLASLVWGGASMLEYDEKKTQKDEFSSIEAATTRRDIHNVRRTAKKQVLRAQVRREFLPERAVLMMALL